MDSLRHRIRKAEREWRAANPIGREYAYGPLRRRLVEMSGRPLRWASLYFLLLALLSVNVWLWWNLYPRWAVFVRLSHSFLGTGHGLSARLTYLTTVWTIQATLAGLVYPIVISFVTILLQRRYNAKAILHIYLADSAAIPSGLSAMALVGVMGAQYLCVPLAPPALVPLWVVLDGVAFLYNLWLTATFLYRTFEFIRPDRRADIIRRYAISVAWPRELREYRAQNIFTEFIDGPPANSAVVVTTNKGALLYRGPVVTTTTSVRKPSRLVDVRFYFLRMAVASWCRQALRHQPGSVGGASPEEALANRPVLVFPLLPGESDAHCGSVVLCQTDGWCGFPGRAQWLFRRAFIFEAVQNSRSSLRISDILGDMQAEAMLAIQANEIQTFTDRLSEWVDLYCHLINEAPFRLPAAIRNDQPGGVLEWGSRPVQLFWKSGISVAAATAFEGLADAAVAKLDTNVEFVLTTIRESRELYRRLRDNIHPSALVDYFWLPPIVFRRIHTWWVTAAEQNGDVDHTACRGVLLRPPFSGTYRQVLRTFVGEWEFWKEDSLPASREGNSPTQPIRPWAVLQNAAEYLHAHMRETLVLFFGCVQRGDKEGAEWLLDVLLKWCAEIEPHYARSIADGLPRRDWLTLEITACAWGEAQKNWAAERDSGWSESGEQELPEAIFWAALRNYWIDACYLALVGLVVVGKRCPCETSLAARLLKALVWEEAPRAGGNIHGNEKPLRNSGEWLFALLRFYEAYLSPGKPPRPQYSYRFRLYGMLGEIVESNGEPRVAGRMYSGLPALTEEMRRDAWLMLWLLLVESAATLPNDARRLEEWVHADPYRAEVFVQDLAGMRARLESAEFRAAYQDITECVASLAGGEGFDNQVTVRGQALGEIVDSLRAITRSAIARGPISEARVQEASRDFSDSGIFTPHPWHFPVRLFRSVSEVAHQGAEGAQSQSWVASMRRAAFIESCIGNPDALDNRDRMKLRFEKEVAAGIVANVIEQLNPDEARAGTPQEWWARVKTFSEECKKSGLQPLCVLAGQTLPDWLLRWAHPGGDDNAAKPGDLRLWRNQEWSQVDGYVGNLGDVPAFHCLPLAGQSYLLVRESLDRVTFARWEGGYFVRASVNPDQNDDVGVVLQLAWRAKVEVEARPALRLMYD